MSLRVSVVLFDTNGAVMKSSTVAYSATALTDDMPSTGIMTFMPRNAAPLAVKSTAPFDDVPTAITVLMPLSLRTFARSVFRNLSGPASTCGSFACGRDIRKHVGGRRVGDDAVDDGGFRGARVREQLFHRRQGGDAARPLAAILFHEIEHQQRGGFHIGRDRFEHRR